MSGLELHAVGGYLEVGRQCTALRVDDEVVIIDMGLHLDHYINYTADDQEDISTSNLRGLRGAGAIPDYTTIKDWRKRVRAIILTHAHLDHLGAVPYLAGYYDCPVYGSPFTIALLKELLKDKKLDFQSELITVEDKVEISENITVEFIPMTHSTVDSRLIAVHTPYGVVACDNDYKLDSHPTLGPTPDMERLSALSGKVVAHIAECLYAPHASRTPSESVARKMLEEVLLEQDFSRRAVFVSTFSSHIARLQSIMDIGQAMGRKVVFMGRSMTKYLAAAEATDWITVPPHVEVIKYGADIRKFFRKHRDDLSQFLIVCTGHMGEQKAALSKLVDGKYPFRFKAGDVVVFSSSVIPVPTIIASRKELERKLRDRHVRFFTGVHVSGHASKEDIRTLMTTLNATHLFPNHGDANMTRAYIDIAKDVGIPNERIHSLHEGDRFLIVDGKKG